MTDDVERAMREMEERFARLPPEALTAGIMTAIVALDAILGPERASCIALTIAEKVRREALASGRWNQETFEQTRKLADLRPWPEHLQED